VDSLNVINERRQSRIPSCEVIIIRGILIFLYFLDSIKPMIILIKKKGGTFVIVLSNEISFMIAIGAVMVVIV
jgi:hypothetical protein